jgi:hypothetical protein
MNNFYCSDFLLFPLIKIHKSLAFDVFGETGSVSKREVKFYNEFGKEFDHFRSFEDFTQGNIPVSTTVAASMTAVHFKQVFTSGQWKSE